MMVDRLHFWGQQEPPLLPGQIVQRVPVPGEGERPPELAELGQKHALYVSTAGEDRPQVDVVRLEDRGEGAVWRVEVSGTSPRMGARLGGSVDFSAPEVVAQQIDPAVGFSGYRPPWNHLFYIPRSLPSTAPRLRRLNGRRMNPLYVFGSDDRRVYQDTSYPWGCVGKVYTSDGKAGSAALAGRDLIVTAGHMIPDASHGWWMRFVPDYFDGQSLHGAGVESYVSDVKGYQVSNVAGYDWAIGKLYTALGDSLGYFGYNGWSSSWEKQNFWTVAGYPAAVAGGERPSWQSGIDYHDEDGDSNGGEELESNTADTGPGNSGGPMFGWWNSDPRIIAVVSGEETEYQFPAATDANNIFASGSGFTNLIAWGRTNW